MITMTCRCGEIYHADEHYVGRAILCKNCERALLIRLQETVPSSPPEPQVQKVGPESVRGFEAKPFRRYASRVKPAIVCALFFCVTLIVWWKPEPQNPPFSHENGTDGGSPVPSKPPVSLENGTELTGFLGTGLGSLRISNGTSTDAVTKLRTPADIDVCEVYIKAGHEWRIKRIPPGSYALLFGLGIDWDLANGRFIRDRRYSTFAETFVFTETPKANAISYRLYEVTLNPVPGGRARTLSIDEKEFEGKADLFR